MKKKRFTDTDLATAKRVSIIDYLSIQGFKPEKESNGKVWYKSPLRSEKTASFVVLLNTNHFIDYSNNHTGDIIELVSNLKGISFVDAVNQLVGGIDSNTFSFHCPNGYADMPKEKETFINLNTVKPFDTNKAITSYVVDKRFIGYDVAKEYLKEYYFSMEGQKQKYGVSLGANILGGFNINCGFKVKGRWFKSVIGKTAPNIIRNPNSNRWCIFEAMFDFLSWLVLNNLIKCPYNVAVLNSTNNIDKLGIPNKSELLCYLDNDETGKKAFQKLSTMYRCTDKSEKYSNHKDLNDFLTSKK